MVMHLAVLVRHARVLGEHQRLDRHGHRVRRHADAPEVDVVEVAQRNAVDDQQLGGDAHVLLEDAAERLRDVAVEDEVNRFFPTDGSLQALAYATRESRYAFERWLAAPAQRQRDLRLPLLEVEFLEMPVDRGGQLLRVHFTMEMRPRLQHLQVAPGQQLAGGGYVYGVAGELH